ncbi:O-methyltransferase [Roseivirga spongicola]|uniref:Methyltransferase n=1 Tax=Roseivirga spongicola TaxID=333140 RepID=A0A150WXH1_9BACT|nr:O-methyltransferase [Roseivirga spongicola]KYG71201.1 methyltransferase [Roseivirga spongicola]WPZ12254.1 O-methyltransferase [Roseivirga spongicola]
MEFIPEDIQKYVEEHSGKESELLSKLDRETHQKVLMPRMLSGHLQGRVLSMVSHMMKPSRILEIGTYTGYSAICLAEGLAEGGKLITLDKNEEIEEMVRGYFEEAGLSDQIDYRIGNAMDLIPDIEGPFDLVFIDADKKNYLNYFNLVIEKVRIGGFIIADNVLWSGKVVQTEKKIDTDTQAILDYNRSMEEDDRVENVLLPIRDGLMVVRRKQ